MKAQGMGARAVFAVAVSLGATGASAFHAGGTAECTGCHSMHAPSPTGTQLLRQSDASSVCLSCHQGSTDNGPSTYRVATGESSMPSGTPPHQLSPGGDFGWLKKNYAFEAGGATVQEDGASHGHNIVATDFSFLADPRNTTAPGGTLSSSELSCVSCHDPHGKYRRLSDGSVVTDGAPIIGSGSYDTSPVPQAGQAVGVYRLLAGAGYGKGGVTFTGAPAAVAPETSNRSEAATQTRVAYGHATGNGRDTWANWCATCHPQMLNQGHRTDIALGSDVLANYAAYVKSGDMTGSLVASYLSLVPFAENTADYTTLAAHARSDDSALGGPQTGDLVTCLTCHRAHASGWDRMMRWNDKATFLVYDSLWPGIDSTPGLPEYSRGRTSAETRAAYYDRPATVFASYQRSLCNKCHARD